MIKANYRRFGEDLFVEFEDDELGVAVCFLNEGLYEGGLMILDITDCHGNVLIGAKEIIYGDNQN